MAKKKNNNLGLPGVDYESFKKNILNIFYQNPSTPLNYKQVSKKLLIDDKVMRKLVGQAMVDLSITEDLEEIDKGKFKLKDLQGYLLGSITYSESGFATLETDDFQETIYISQRRLLHAMEGDQVKVRILPKRKNRNYEGEVVEIIKRAKDTFVGTIQQMKNFAFLVPDSRKTPFDLFIPLEQLNGARNGMKVVGEITDWPKEAKNPFGKIKTVLGYPGENDTEINAIMEDYGLPYEFPQAVFDEAEAIDEAIPPREYQQRRDFRKITTFTIDPHDAKDFDDALSIQKLKNGNWEVGVHIADVTYYLKTKTQLDEEAVNRATSVYLVDRVVPMLPEKLSNKVCSLRPQEEKLTFSAVFELNDNAEMISEWFGRTIIYSDHRFTYEEAQEIIDTEKGILCDEVLTLNRLAQTLRTQRFSKGSIAFERDEIKFHIDENGKPTGVYTKPHGLSNELIEEFMLLANKRVANFIGNVKDAKAKTFVYRIHDKPNMEKLENFGTFIKKFGYNLETNNEKFLSQSINSLLLKVKGKTEQNLIETLAIRSMAKAEYSTHNIGHYGLGFKFYAHFTSPIRRYPDVMVHRLLAEYLDGVASKSAKKYEELCEHCSNQERKAAEAERASIKYKQVEFLSDKIGEVFNGVISGVTDWGIYVELDANKCEGLVPMRDLDDDFYEYDEDNYCLKGTQDGNIYQLGDKVVVRIKKANLFRKQLDFELVDTILD